MHLPCALQSQYSGECTLLAEIHVQCLFLTLLSQHHEPPAKSPVRKATPPTNTFLKRGEGIARFGMKVRKFKRKGSSPLPTGNTKQMQRQRPHKDDDLAREEEESLLSSSHHHQPHPSSPPPLTTSSSSVPRGQPSEEQLRAVAPWDCHGGREEEEDSAAAVKVRPPRVRKIAQAPVWSGGECISNDGSEVSGSVSSMSYHFTASLMYMCVCSINLLFSFKEVHLCGVHHSTVYITNFC